MKLAQLNIALAKYPLDAPEIKEFVDNLDLVNGIAEESEGFIWRLKDDSGDATSIKLFDDPNMIVNMSVWENTDSLKNFMFRTGHRDFMRRKSEWFHRLAEDTYVLWWVETVIYQRHKKLCPAFNICETTEIRHLLLRLKRTLQKLILRELRV